MELNAMGPTPKQLLAFMALGIILSYSLGWLRLEENMYLDLPFQIAQEQPKEIRELVGYPMHGPLGFFDPRVADSQS